MMRLSTEEELKITADDVRYHTVTCSYSFWKEGKLLCFCDDRTFAFTKSPTRVLELEQELERKNATIRKLLQKEIFGALTSGEP